MERLRNLYISAPSLLRVLGGDVDYLSCAFLWSASPQGGDYWAARSRGVTPLSVEDLEYLSKLVAEVAAKRMV